MDPDDGQDEDEPLFPWLPPDDRLWRHPSELAGRSASSAAPGAGSDAVASHSRSGEGSALSLTRTSAGVALRDVDRRLWTVALLAGVIGALVAAGAGVLAGQYNRSTTVVRPIEKTVDPSTPYVTVADAQSNDIVGIAARLRPTIVELLVNGDAGSVDGSGVIFRSDGYVLTDDHIVDGAQSILAVTSDGHRINCRIVGADPATDIAVVKLLDYQTEPVADLGSSTQLKVGQTAIAVGLLGSPRVSSGIISGVDLQVDPGNGPSLDDMIQTNAAVLPGTSGGALVDTTGMVVGITTAIASANQNGQTLSFATPIEVARDVANQLLSTGTVTHTWLGVDGADIDVAMEKALGIDAGAVVQSVDSGSPAARAGLNPADVVIAFAGQPIASMSDLDILVHEQRPGDRVPLTFIRGGQTRIAEVELANRPVNDFP